MAHLFGFRQGWQSENIAKFILSKFSFVAEPSTISDDIGSDFFCTMFRIKDKKCLLPQNSFSIQIKSKKDVKKSKNLIDITKHSEHLFHTEIPFFVGVVDKDKLKMEIYSGDSLQHFVSKIGGVPEGRKVFIKLVDSFSEMKELYKILGNEAYIRFSKIVEIDASFDYQKTPEHLNILFDACRLIQENIASKISTEYIYKILGSDVIQIYAGSSSAKTFRDNFLKRLLEVFYNLNWLLDNGEFDKKEYECYKEIHSMLFSLYKGKIPPSLADFIDIIDKKLSKRLLFKLCSKFRNIESATFVRERNT